MEKSKKASLLAVIFIFLAMILGCEVERSPQTEVQKDQPVVLNGVSVLVQQARLRGSLQNYYLMQYPDPGYVFMEVILTIEGLAASPDSILNWGKENFYLDCEGIQPDLTSARRIIVNEDVLYKSGEELDFDYIYFYRVPQEMDFEGCNLIFSDGQRLSLTPIAQPAELTVRESDEQGVVLSGKDNQAFGEEAVVAGGTRNAASAVHTVVSGGDLNAATASHATVGGGRENIASDFYAAVGGGFANMASARDAFVGGGSRNTAGGPRSVVGGGIQNQALAPDTAIAGGAYNQVSDGFAAITGGTRNTASGYASIVGGGAGNRAGNDQAAVVGGLNNQVDGKYGFIGGGYGNAAQGNYATVPGGFQNQAAGDYSFAAGNHARVAADHLGTFVFADASAMEFPSMAENEFAVRATGGVRFVTAVDAEGGVISGVQLLPGSGAWSTLSDRSAKAGFEAIDPQAILKAISGLPISTWRYQSQAESIRHLGPLAQDFYAAFGLGEDARYISTVDADGVSLAAIQGLYQLVQQQQTQIESQEVDLLDLKARLLAIEQKKCLQLNSQPNYVPWLGWFFLMGWGIWRWRKR